MDRIERSQRHSEGYDLRSERRGRAERAGKTYEEARELWSRTAKDASICAQCFKPLAPTDSVTLEGRTVSHWHGVRVPVCLLCTLTAMTKPFHFLGRLLVRTRCLICGRPLRVWIYTGRRTALNLSERCCCANCERKARNERNNLRRHVKHEEQICENPECGRSFMPKRADALTCSSKCRQAVHRMRARQAAVTGEGVTDR